MPVDVRVLDRVRQTGDRFKAGDFTVLEDKTRQEIRHFSAHGLVAETPASAAAGAPQGGRRFDDAEQSHFLLVLGRGCLQPSSNAIDAAIKFVRTRLLPQDQIAVLAYNRATDFGTDHEQFAKLLERYKTAHETIETDLREYFSGLRAIYGARMCRRSFSKINAIFDAPGPPARAR